MFWALSGEWSPESDRSFPGWSALRGADLEWTTTDKASCDEAGVSYTSNVTGTTAISYGQCSSLSLGWYCGRCENSVTTTYGIMGYYTYPSPGYMNIVDVKCGGLIVATCGVTSAGSPPTYGCTNEQVTNYDCGDLPRIGGQGSQGE